jgi:hypothetical protein
MELFDRVFSESKTIVGTAYHEWIDSRELGKQAWGMEGVALAPGDPVAWEEGDVAWAVDRPALSSVTCAHRFASGRAAEGGRRLEDPPGHFSVGVPDEVGFEKAAEWSQATPSH